MIQLNQMKEKIDEKIGMFVELGLRSQEAKVYLACLEIGQAPATQISENSGIQRTFVYDILDDLAEKGLVSLVEIGGIKKFSTLAIDKFRALQKAKLQKFDAILPEIKALEKTTGDRPKVQFFEGVEGIKATFEDTLKTLDKGGEILAYVTAEGFYQNEWKYAQDYIKRRVEKGISGRGIMQNSKEITIFTKPAKEELRTFRLVPPDLFPFSNEINIYANKVAIMSLVGEQMSVIIESESVANTQRSIFELAWLGAEKLVAGRDKGF
jgi:sugar-specific transcriptional regulator TrmB